jgi:hypothetical protein
MFEAFHSLLHGPPENKKGILRGRTPFRSRDIAQNTITDSLLPADKPDNGNSTPTLGTGAGVHLLRPSERRPSDFALANQLRSSDANPNCGRKIS